ncbi:hypothetical protein HMPREF3214_00971 [Alloscardovia omnicolens]|nr:hypothetical protein HMPREF3214_00971 [Alloscardovia omnicolens]
MKPDCEEQLLVTHLQPKTPLKAEGPLNSTVQTRKQTLQVYNLLI